ncbi:hypothetical protein F5Y09DRAFT_339741 [Xylaria sp. FL1042]|nr:hypothetical protein F5Y09DRAFT_339741 [Xylaria sp. FL1042]
MSSVTNPSNASDAITLPSSVEKAIRIHAKEMMAKTGERLRREAEVDFRKKLFTELCNIITATETTLKLAHHECQEDQADISEKNAIHSVNDNIDIAELYRTAANTFMKYYIFGDEMPKNVESDEYGLIALQEQYDKDNPVADKLELPRPKMNRHHDLEEDLMRPSVTRSDTSSSSLSSPPSIADEPLQLDTKGESDDNKDSRRGNDDEEIPSHQRIQLPFTWDAPQTSLTDWSFQPTRPRRPRTQRPWSSPARPRERERSKSPVNRSPKKATHSEKKMKSSRQHPLARSPAFRRITGSEFSPTASRLTLHFRKQLARKSACPALA